MSRARAVWAIFRPCSSVPVWKRHVAALLALETRNRVGGDHLIGMADMRAAVGIVNRGGDVIGFGHAGVLEQPCIGLKGNRSPNHRSCPACRTHYLSR